MSSLFIAYLFITIPCVVGLILYYKERTGTKGFIYDWYTTEINVSWGVLIILQVSAIYTYFIK